MHLFVLLIQVKFAMFCFLVRMLRIGLYIKRLANETLFERLFVFLF